MIKLKNIFSRRNKILLRELVVTDFKLRYQGSVLGYLWSVLRPLFLFAILYVVFEKFLRMGRDIEHFGVYLLLGIVLWTFFTEATNMGLQAIINRGDLIRKINFPNIFVPNDLPHPKVHLLHMLFQRLVLVQMYSITTSRGNLWPDVQ